MGDSFSCARRGPGRYSRVGTVAQLCSQAGAIPKDKLGLQQVGLLECFPTSVDLWVAGLCAGSQNEYPKRSSAAVWSLWVPQKSYRFTSTAFCSLGHPRGNIQRRRCMLCSTGNLGPCFRTTTVVNRLGRQLPTPDTVLHRA